MNWSSQRLEKIYQSFWGSYLCTLFLIYRNFICLLLLILEVIMYKHPSISTVLICSIILTLQYKLISYSYNALIKGSIYWQWWTSLCLHFLLKVRQKPLLLVIKFLHCMIPCFSIVISIMFSIGLQEFMVLSNVIHLVILWKYWLR